MFVILFFLPFYVLEGGRREKKHYQSAPKKPNFGCVSGLLLQSNMPGKGENPHVAPLKAFDLHAGPAGQAQG